MSSNASCLLCPGGFYCEGYGNKNYSGKCSEGFYCPVGVDSPTPSMYKCQPRYYCPNGSSSMINCTGGNYCQTSMLSSPTGECFPGYYCPINSLNPNERVCPPGYFCGKGTEIPSPCPKGTYSASERGVNNTVCLLCTAGFYCNTTGMSMHGKECDFGYYCPPGQYEPTPPAYMCIEGHFCGLGFPLPQRCENGTFQNNKGASSCIKCPRGYYCDNTVSPVDSLNGRLCPVGYYCPPETRYANEFGCLPGTWSNKTGLNDSSQCQPCPKQ